MKLEFEKLEKPLRILCEENRLGQIAIEKMILKIENNYFRSDNGLCGKDLNFKMSNRELFERDTNEKEFVFLYVAVCDSLFLLDLSDLFQTQNLIR